MKKISYVLVFVAIFMAIVAGVRDGITFPPPPPVGWSFTGGYQGFYDGDSNYAALTVPNLSSDIVVTLPSSTGTLAVLGANTFTANQTATAFIPTTAANAEGEFGFLSNAFSWFANSEDLIATAGTDMWTISSSTGAAVTFTPAVTVTGIVTANSGVSSANGDTSAGFIDFYEKSSNGTNYARLKGPESSGDVVLSLPATTGTLALTQDKLSVFAATSSAELAGVVSDETGTGLVVLSNSPTFVDDITLGSSGVGGSIVFNGSSSGTTTLQPAAAAGTTTLTMPARTGQVQVASACSAITGTEGVATLTVGLSNCYTWTVTDNEDTTLTASAGGTAGDEITIIFTTAGTADEVITFHSTNIASTGTLTIGTTAARYYTIRFISNGTRWFEVSRTGEQT